LVKQISAIVVALILLRAELDKLKLTSMAKNTLTSFEEGMKVLVAAMKEKLPKGVQPVADDIENQVVSELDKGIKAIS